MTITTGIGLPVAANETATTTADASVAIDLTQGSSGNPTAAQLVGTPIGGTVTGFPSTSVTFTPDPDFSGTASFSFTLSNAAGTSNTATASITVSPVNLAANLGNGPDCGCGSILTGEPINTATGNEFETEADFIGDAHTGLSLTRYYNSKDTTKSAFGQNWHSTWHRRLKMANSTVTVIRADGREDDFRQNASGVWTPQPNVTSTLTPIMNGATLIGWNLTLADDSVELYSPVGELQSITTRAGLTTTLAYDTKCHLLTVIGPFGHVMSFTYDALNRVATMTAPDGGIYSYAYDANNNLVSVTYPDNRTRQYVYENASLPNALTGIVDENGSRYVTIAYDSQGRGVSSEFAGGVRHTAIAYNNDGTATVTDANGNIATYNFTNQFHVFKAASLSGAPLPNVGGSAFTYDTSGFLASKTDYDGNVLALTHDARGNETSRTEASGSPLARTTNTTWHSTFHLPLSITEPTGRVTTFSYDAHGNLLTKTVTAGSQSRTTAYTYNASGQVLTMTDPNGNLTRYVYDTRGNLASQTDALGHVTSYNSYDGAGRLLAMTDPNGLLTTFTYDPRGHMTSRNVGGETTFFAYDAAGNRTKVTAPDGSFTASTFDAAHRLTQIRDALGNQMQFTLDGNDNRTAVRNLDTLGNTTQTRSFAYDNVNRLVKEVGAQNQTTLYAYDPQGNLLSVTDPLSHVTQFAYDQLNRKSQATDAAGGITLFAYDALDRLTSETDPRGLTTNYSYDGMDDQTSIASPDSGTTIKTYDTIGNVLSSTDARKQTTIYSYDSLNRMIKVAYADGTSSTYQYDQGLNGIGHLTAMTDPAGATSFTYDQHRRLLQKIQTANANTKNTNPALSMSYSYDASGRMASLTYPSGTQVSLKYDADGRIASLAQGITTLAQNVQYQPFGTVAGWTQGNGASYSRAFDQDGRITSMSMGGTIINLGYDASSHIVAQSETGLSVKTYGYDALDRLASFADGASGTNYFYDADGNRTINATTNGNTVYTYALASNRLLSRSGLVNETDTYDATGNLINDGLHSFTYSARGRMAQATTKGNTISYGINGLGQRISKAGMGVQPSGINLFMYDTAGHLLGEYDDKGNAVEEIVWLGDLPVTVSNGNGGGGGNGNGGGNGKGNGIGAGNANTNNLFFISPDHLGSPHIITDSKGKLAWSWNHDPFGATDPVGQGNFTFDLRFPGQIHDNETGFNYNMFRDYRLDIGRYVESDPLGLFADVNTYGYVGQNPLKYADPLGLCSGDRKKCEHAYLSSYLGLGNWVTNNLVSNFSLTNIVSFGFWKTSGESAGTKAVIYQGVGGLSRYAASRGYAGIGEALGAFASGGAALVVGAGSGLTTFSTVVSFFAYEQCKDLDP